MYMYMHIMILCYPPYEVICRINTLSPLVSNKISRQNLTIALNLFQYFLCCHERKFLLYMYIFMYEDECKNVYETIKNIYLQYTENTRGN